MKAGFLLAPRRNRCEAKAKPKGSPAAEPPSCNSGRGNANRPVTAADLHFAAWIAAQAGGLYRPCVDCGQMTGGWCDTGSATGSCPASLHLPNEGFAPRQATPLCNQCDTMHGRCRFCRMAPSQAQAKAPASGTRAARAPHDSAARLWVVRRTMLALCVQLDTISHGATCAEAAATHREIAEQLQAFQLREKVLVRNVALTLTLSSEWSDWSSGPKLAAAARNVHRCK